MRLTSPHPLIEHFLSGLSIYRWNTFPRLREITSLDHLIFVAHTALLIAFMRKEKEGVEYDIGLLLRKVLFSGFFTFIYSDISSDVKERIRRTHPEIYLALESTLQGQMLAWDISENIKQDIRSMQEKTPEDTLISFAKIWVSYYEIYHNSLVYADAYAKAMQSILHRSEHADFAPFLQYLDFDPHNQTPPERYLLVIHRLASSYRWNRSTRKYPVSVLSHTYIVTFFTYLIAREKGYDDATLEDMLLTALYHDIPEAITGDIITPTKKAVPGLEDAIIAIERDMVEDYLLSYLDGYSFTPLLARKMLTPWGEVHGDMVKQADILSAYHEARIEAPNSQEYEEVMRKLEGKIKNI